MTNKIDPWHTIDKVLDGISIDLDANYNPLLSDYAYAYARLLGTDASDTTLSKIRARRVQLSDKRIKASIASHMAVKIDEAVSSILEPTPFDSTTFERDTEHASATPPPKRRGRPKRVTEEGAGA